MHLKLVNQNMVCLLNTSGIKLGIIYRLLDNSNSTSWKFKPLAFLTNNEGLFPRVWQKPSCC